MTEMRINSPIDPVPTLHSYFCMADPAASLDPLPTTVDEEHPARYAIDGEAPLTAGEMEAAGWALAATPYAEGETLGARLGLIPPDSKRDFVNTQKERGRE
tara:strand:+ start:536 stop:838 length:303 start_codon:yes stop_codon:yes gene_type:complete